MLNQDQNNQNLSKIFDSIFKLINSEYIGSVIIPVILDVGFLLPKGKL